MQPFINYYYKETLQGKEATETTDQDLIDVGLLQSYSNRGNIG